MPESRELSPRECEMLLRAGVAGRVAISTPTGPHILPVNYAVVGDAITFRTSPYSLLGTYARDNLLAFEIDGFEPEHSRGWSVQARGRAELITDREELEHVRRTSDPEPWAGGTRSLYLRLRWTELSGRQVGPTWELLAETPVPRAG